MLDNIHFTPAFCTSSLHHIHFDMTAIDYLYYGFGQIIYALSFSDGSIQQAEKKKLAELIEKSTEQDHDLSLQVTQIIFQLLDKEHLFSTEEMFAEGIKNMQLGDQHLTPQKLVLFKKILSDVAASFPPTTENEKAILDRFSNTFK